MKIIRIVMASIIALMTFALISKLLRTLGDRIIGYFNLDRASEFGANMVATNTLVGFVVALLFAIMVFMLVKGKNENKLK